MASKAWISTARKGSVFLLMVAFLSTAHAAIKTDEDIVPTSTLSSVIMNDMLFKNLSDSFSTKEIEEAMVSLNRTKRQSLNLQQLALLAGLNNNMGAAGAVASTGQNTSNNGKQSTEGKP